MRLLVGSEGANSGSSLGEALEAVASALVEQGEDPTPVLRCVCREACSLTGADGAFVAVPEGPGARFLDLVAWHGDLPPRALEMRIPLSGTATGASYSGGSVVVVDDFSEALPASSVLAQIFEVESGVFAPLKPLGVLAVLSRERRHFNKSTVAQVRCLAALASAGIRLAEASRAAGREAVLSGLHDGAMQFFYAALLKTDSIRRASSLTPEELRRIADEISDLIRDGLHEMRREISGEVPADASLGERLESIAQRLGTDVTVRTVMEGGDLPGRHPWTSQLARIALEATSNAIRHGKASEVVIEFRRGPHGSTLTVTDDGVGFDIQSTPKGMGLVNLPKRAEAIGADFSIESEPGSGTRVVVEIPHRS